MALSREGLFTHVFLQISITRGALLGLRMEYQAIREIIGTVLIAALLILLTRYTQPLEGYPRILLKCMHFGMCLKKKIIASMENYNTIIHLKKPDCFWLRG